MRAVRVASLLAPMIYRYLVSSSTAGGLTSGNCSSAEVDLLVTRAPTTRQKPRE